MTQTNKPFYEILCYIYDNIYATNNFRDKLYNKMAVDECYELLYDLLYNYLSPYIKKAYPNGNITEYSQVISSELSLYSVLLSLHYIITSEIIYDKFNNEAIKLINLWMSWLARNNTLYNYISDIVNKNREWKRETNLEKYFIM